MQETYNNQCQVHLEVINLQNPESYFISLEWTKTIESTKG